MKRRNSAAPQPWIDLSTGINPIPYPLPTLPSELWARLPTYELHDALIAAAAARYGVSDAATIVAAPGTQALIQLLPRLMPKSRVAVVGPTYEEHEVSWRRHGHDVAVVDDLSAAAGAEVAVLVNPDNPTGRLIACGTLRAFKGQLIVDEAFADFLPPAGSLAGDLPANTIVLRSFGKTYGLAGVRLGFAIAERTLARRIRDELGPWAVSGPALEIGRQVLADDAWLRSSARRLEDDGRRLEHMLGEAGFTMIGGTPLFRLARHDNAPRLVEALGRQGIHVRSFAREPTWLRFGLPGGAAAFDRLAAALR